MKKNSLESLSLVIIWNLIHLQDGNTEEKFMLTILEKSCRIRNQLKSRILIRIQKNIFPNTQHCLPTCVSSYQVLNPVTSKNYSVWEINQAGTKRSWCVEQNLTQHSLTTVGATHKAVAYLPKCSIFCKSTVLVGKIVGGVGQGQTVGEVVQRHYSLSEKNRTRLIFSAHVTKQRKSISRFLQY